MENPQVTRPRRERPKPVRLTEAAASRLRQIMADAEGKYLGVRVGVTNGGCAGMSYTMNYAEQTGPLDEVLEDQGVKIFIEPKAIMFLIGTEMDFETTKIRSGFVFRNPNEVSSCGCGESVNLKPAAPEALGA